MENQDYQEFINFINHISDESLRKFLIDFIDTNPQYVSAIIEFYKKTGDAYLPNFHNTGDSDKAHSGNTRYIQKMFELKRKDQHGKMVTHWPYIFARSRKMASDMVNEIGTLRSEAVLDKIMQWFDGFTNHFHTDDLQKYPVEDMRKICCPFLDVLLIYAEQEDVSDDMLKALVEWLFGIIKKGGEWRLVCHTDLVNMAIKVVSLKRVPKTLRATLLEDNQDIEAIKCHYVKTNFLTLIESNEEEKANEYIAQHLTDYGVLGFYLQFLKARKSYLFLMHLITTALLGGFPTRELKECIDMVYELYLQGKRDMGKLNIPLPGFLPQESQKDPAEIDDKKEENQNQDNGDKTKGREVAHRETDGNDTETKDTGTKDTGTKDTGTKDTGNSGEEVVSTQENSLSKDTENDSVEDKAEETTEEETSDVPSVTETSDNSETSENTEAPSDAQQSLPGFDLDLSDIDKIEIEELQERLKEDLKSVIESNAEPFELKPEDMSSLNVYLMIPDDSMAENYRLYFIRTHGDMTYFRRMKKLVPPEHWDDYLKKTMEETEFLPSMYLDDDRLWEIMGSNTTFVVNPTDSEKSSSVGPSKKKHYLLPPRVRSNIIEVFIEEGDYDSLAKYMLEGKVEDFYDSILDMPVDKRKDLLEEYYRRILNLMSNADSKDQFISVLPHLNRLIEADTNDEYIKDFIELEKSIFEGNEQIHAEWILFLVRNGFSPKGDRLNEGPKGDNKNE